MDNTISMDKKLNGINFEIIFYFENEYISSDPFEQNEPGFIEIQKIQLASFPAVKIPQNVIIDIMEYEDCLCDEITEISKEDF